MYAQYDQVGLTAPNTLSHSLFSLRSCIKSLRNLPFICFIKNPYPLQGYFYYDHMILPLLHLIFRYADQIKNLRYKIKKIPLTDRFHFSRNKFSISALPLLCIINKFSIYAAPALYNSVFII